jgi:hypothetical protein
LATLLALMLGGCGGSSSNAASAQVSTAKVSATAYVTSLCQAVAPFEKQVASGASALNSKGSSTLAADKARLAGYFAELARDSSGAVGKLDRAGVPDVSGGAAFAAAIRSTFARVNTALSRSQTLAANLSTASAAAFTSGADKLASAVKSSLGQLGSGLSTKKSQALTQAAAKVSACHTL